MSERTAMIYPAWSARRLISFGVVMLLVAYSTVFIVDGDTPSLSLFVSAIANVSAAMLAALPVYLLCRSVTWQRGERWWFLPLHLLGAATFGLLWFAAIAVALGVGGLFSGQQFSFVFLAGPALHWQALTSVILYFAIVGGCYVTQASRAAQIATALQHKAEVGALRAQLDPHLLFNTLHSLLELVRSGDARADDAIDRFARVARYVTEGRTPDRDVVPLNAEWRMVQDYISLEALRLGSRLTYTFTLGDQLDTVSVPALSLQPLVENAIRHGVAPRPGPGHITMSAERVGNDVHLQIVDNGLGSGATTRGSGTGLDLVRRRFEARYGAGLQFDAGPRSDAVGWRVCVRFPVTVA
jgi:Histidine kinase